MVEKVKFLYRKDCHDCDMRKEIETHKEIELNKKDSAIETLERKLSAMEKKKNELQKELKKTKTSENNYKTELKKCQEMLAESCKKVSAQTATIDTLESSAEVTDDDGNQKIKCYSCDFNARNAGMLEVHKKAEHSSASEFKCNVCNQEYPNQDNLEVHMAVNHTGDVDCAKCKAVFRKEQDVFDHANDCTEVLQVNKCNICDREVISKAALKKHSKSCHPKKLNVLCRNGSSCSYLKANRCSFSHPETQKLQPKQFQAQNQEWHTVQRKSRKILWTCRFCSAKIHSHEAGRNHICEQLKEKRTNGQPNSLS